MSTEGILLIIGALTTALTALIPLYFREKAKLKIAEKQRDVVIDSVDEAGPGPISAGIKSRIKTTSMAMGIPVVEERTNGKEEEA
jgi:hypothetical protein